MSEGTFCRVGVHICYIHIILSIWIGKQAVIAYIYISSPEDDPGYLRGEQIVMLPSRATIVYIVGGEAGWRRY